MFKHAEFRKIISSYIDGEVTQRERDMVAKHMEECRACKRYHDELKISRGYLRDWKDEELTPDLEVRIRNSFLGSRHKKGGIKMKARRSIIIGVGSLGLAAVLALVITGQFMTNPNFRQMIFGGSIAAVKPIGIEGGKDMKTDEISGKEITLVEKPVQVEKLAVTREVKDISGPSNSKTVPLSNMIPGAEGRPAMKAHYADAMTYEADSAAAIIGREDFNTEAYDRIYENRFLSAKDNPYSTFSIDVDTASYSNIRRFLNMNRMPVQDSVRIEEMINYFTYNYNEPKGDKPFNVTVEMHNCPWNEKRRLALIGLQGRNIDTKDLPASNLVFLLDVSGSMNQPNKLPLLKQAFKLLVNNLRKQDRASIVVYAGAAGLVLDSARGDEKEKIMMALDSLKAGGSTAGGAGIKLAYEMAKKNFIKDGNNRVILATDGDFNIGASSDAEMVRLIEDRRDDGIFLTTLGFGMGNYKDSKMEKLADKGNGNAAYIDNLLEAKKVFVNELNSTLFTIAKDVKLQIEFNPAKVKAYRLIGYENRMLKKEDFNDDKKDAGELGAGHSVTALYEIVPADSTEDIPDVDPMKYQKTVTIPSDDVLTVKLRYKNPDEDKSKLLEGVILDSDLSGKASENFLFASAVAEFGLILRRSEHKGNASYESVLARARSSKGEDKYGYRAEFIKLVEMAEILDQ